MAFQGTDTPDTAIFVTPGGVLTATPFAAMGWVRMTAVNSGTPMGVWSSAVDADRAWRIRMNGDPSPRANVSLDGAAQLSASHPSTLALNVWFHIGLDFDGSTLRLFVDGVNSVSASFSGTVFSSTREMGIGAYDGGGGASSSELDGDLEDMRYYNRILTAEEWATVHRVRGLDGIAHGLLTRWPINEQPTGTVITTTNVKDIGPGQFAVARIEGTPEYIEGELRDRRAA